MAQFFLHSAALLHRADKVIGIIHESEEIDTEDTIKYDEHINIDLISVKPKVGAEVSYRIKKLNAISMALFGREFKQGIKKVDIVNFLRSDRNMAVILRNNELLAMRKVEH